MRCNFVLGQKVVCIKSGGWRSLDGERITNATPQVDSIYTITGMMPLHNDVYLQLADLDPCDVWISINFRALEERKTDIAIFTAMLTPRKEPVAA